MENGTGLELPPLKWACPAAMTSSYDGGGAEGAKRGVDRQIVG